MDETGLKSNSNQTSPIYYAAVAGDILGTYERWRQGQRDERQIAATYSGQFFDLCVRLGRQGAASFPSNAKQWVSDGSFVIRSRSPVQKVRGVLFYLDQLRRAVWLSVDVLRTGANDVFVMDGITFFFMLAPLAWTGRRIVLSVHTVLWREGVFPSRMQRLTRKLDAWFLRKYCAGCLVASPTIANQLRSMVGYSYLPIVLFYPLYQQADFERFSPPVATSRPFRIFFAGRIERDKGVFDLLESTRKLVEAGRDVHLDFCGDGTQLANLLDTVEKGNLQGRVSLQGHLDRVALLDLLDQAHIVVVPTRSDFPEGLNQVVIEAILARRPVITSEICPALELVRPAAVEAEADNVESYRRAIERLIDDPELYAKLVQGGNTLRTQFFDPARAWTAKACEMIKAKKNADT